MRDFCQLHKYMGPRSASFSIRAKHPAINTPKLEIARRVLPAPTSRAYALRNATLAFKRHHNPRLHCHPKSANSPEHCICVYIFAYQVQSVPTIHFVLAKVSRPRRPSPFSINPARSAAARDQATSTPFSSLKSPRVRPRRLCSTLFPPL